MLRVCLETTYLAGTTVKLSMSRINHDLLVHRAIISQMQIDNGNYSIFPRFSDVLLTQSLRV